MLINYLRINDRLVVLSSRGYKKTKQFYNYLLDKKSQSIRKINIHIK